MCLQDSQAYGGRTPKSDFFNTDTETPFWVCFCDCTCRNIQSPRVTPMASLCQNPPRLSNIASPMKVLNLKVLHSYCMYWTLESLHSNYEEDQPTSVPFFTRVLS